MPNCIDCSRCGSRFTRSHELRELRVFVLRDEPSSNYRAPSPPPCSMSADLRRRPRPDGRAVHGVCDRPGPENRRAPAPPSPSRRCSVAPAPARPSHRRRSPAGRRRCSVRPCRPDRWSAGTAARSPRHVATCLLIANAVAQRLQRVLVRAPSSGCSRARQSSRPCRCDRDAPSRMPSSDGAAPTAVLQRVGVGSVGKQLDAVALEERRLRRERAGLLVFVGQRARGDLAGFDVRLVERVDAEDRARNRRRNLPAEELGRQVVCSSGRGW